MVNSDIFKTKKNKFFGIGLVFLIFLDRLLKWFILKNPDFYSGELIELKLFKNTKLYFISLNPFFLYLLIGTALLLFIFLFFKTQKLGFALIVLGGLSNLFDRIFFGYVIDWIRIFILPISVFNIADLMIITGILLLGLSTVKQYKYKV